MVLAARLVSWLAKLLVPVPLLVFVDRFIIGLGNVLHTTPFAVIPTPPSDRLNPPEVAEEEVKFVMLLVDSDGLHELVIKFNSIP